MVSFCLLTKKHPKGSTSSVFFKEALLEKPHLTANVVSHEALHRRERLASAIFTLVFTRV